MAIVIAILTNSVNSGNAHLGLPMPSGGLLTLPPSLTILTHKQQQSHTFSSTGQIDTETNFIEQFEQPSVSTSSPVSTMQVNRRYLCEYLTLFQTIANHSCTSITAWLSEDETSTAVHACT